MLPWKMGGVAKHRAEQSHQGLVEGSGDLGCGMSCVAKSWRTILDNLFRVRAGV